MAPWNNEDHELGGIRSSEDAEGWPEKLSYLEAITLLAEAGYTEKKGGKVRSPWHKKSFGTIYEHPEYADLRVDFEKSDTKSKRIIEDTVANTAYHNNDNPVKGSKDDEFWDDQMDPNIRSQNLSWDTFL